MKLSALTVTDVHILLVQSEVLLDQVINSVIKDESQTNSISLRMLTGI